MVIERYELAICRIRQIPEEQGAVAPAFEDYFHRVAAWMIRLDAVCREQREKNKDAAFSEKVSELSEDLLPENYRHSYWNPDYASERMGEKFGPLMSALAAEIRRMMPALFAQDVERAVIRSELFLECYSAFVTAERDCRDAESKGISRSDTPKYYHIRRKIWQYLFDYAEEEADARILGKPDTDPTQEGRLNPQYTADHQEDISLFCDDELMNRELEAVRNAGRRLPADKYRVPGNGRKETFTLCKPDSQSPDDLPKPGRYAPRLNSHQKKLVDHYGKYLRTLQGLLA